AKGGRARIVELGGAIVMGIVYLVIRYGALHLTHGYAVRRMHTRAYELEQTSVAPDGTIVAGRFERWLRVLAMVAAADMLVRLAIIAVKSAANIGPGVGSHIVPPGGSQRCS
ncbi:MAG TPA: hypothetical protein VLV56_04190, partial [Burkholderiales bacterium]|nr:hypothetical protein [Burkholderiales bacterium]